jgi:hypothetical protein
VSETFSQTSSGMTVGSVVTPTELLFENASCMPAGLS